MKRLASGTAVIAERFSLDLRNETSAEQLVILERMAWNDQATTAAEVTALQMFRDLFASRGFASRRADLGGHSDRALH